MSDTNISITGTHINNALLDILMADDIQVGSDLSYQLCKLIYVHHPLGQKIVDLPTTKALSKPRKISVPDSPEALIAEAFEREWNRLGVDKIITNLVRQGRIYGVGSCVMGCEDDLYPTDEPIPLDQLYKLNIYFNVIDTLGTAGSLITSQDQNSIDFQRIDGVRVQGKTYHPARVCIFQNEAPIYLSWTTSAYGYVGRSVYTRALYPLKSFIQSMITDDAVTSKAGLLVAKTKKAGSVIDKTMLAISEIKRKALKSARTGNVLEIGLEDSIETLNMQNTHTCMETARKNVLDNIASSAGLPAKLLSGETFATGFGEGAEDAKEIAEFIDWFRNDLKTIYNFFDLIVQYRAWNPEFYTTVQRLVPSYAAVPYTKAFSQWRESFVAEWENLLKEPDSELIKVEETKFKAITDMIGAIYDKLDPTNQAALLRWAEDNLNDNKQLFPNPLEMDFDELVAFGIEQKVQQEQQAEQAAMQPQGFGGDNEPN